MTRVLLVRLSAMGDLVQSLGAVAALRDARPDLELCLLTQASWAPLVRGLAGLTVVEHDREGGVGAVRRTAKALRALGCAIAIDLQGNWKSAAFAWLSRAKERLGAASRWRQEPASRVLLTRTVDVDGPAHPASVAAALVRALAPTAAIASPRLASTPAEIEQVAGRVRQLGLDPSRPFRIVAVGCHSDPRSQRPAAILRELREAPLPELVLLGPDELAVDVPCIAIVLRQGHGRLRELMALGALVAQNGGDVVGADQGPVHVLAATGAPTTVLFGPQDPVLTAPPGARVLQHPQPPPCMPCRRRRCHHADGPVCMAFTSAEGRVAVTLRGSSTRW